MISAGADEAAADKEQKYACNYLLSSTADLATATFLLSLTILSSGNLQRYCDDNGQLDEIASHFLFLSVE